MNILLVSGHPAQIHNFKHLKFKLEKKGHRVFWLATEKEISKYLLDHYRINYSLLKRPRNNLVSKALIFITNTIISLKFLKKNQIDITISRISPNISIAWFKLEKKN